MPKADSIPRNPSAAPQVRAIGCLVNVHKMPITRFEMLDDRVGFKRARSRRQVLEVIAGKSNADGTGAYTSDAYIVSKTGFDESWIRRMRKQLRVLDLLHWTDERGFRGSKEGWGSNLYAVSVREDWPRRGVIAEIFGEDLNPGLSNLNPGLSAREGASNPGLSGFESGTNESRLPPPPNCKTPLPPTSGGNGLSHDDLLKDTRNYLLLPWDREQIIIQAAGHRRIFTKRQLDAMTGLYVTYVVDRLRTLGYWAEIYVPSRSPAGPAKPPVRATDPQQSRAERKNGAAA